MTAGLVLIAVVVGGAMVLLTRAIRRARELTSPAVLNTVIAGGAAAHRVDNAERVEPVLTAGMLAGSISADD